MTAEDAVVAAGEIEVEALDMADEAALDALLPKLAAEASNLALAYCQYFQRF